MKPSPLKAIKSADEARNLAIDWQNWQSEQNLSLGTLLSWQEFFEALSKKFPELKDEFAENGLI